MITTVLRVVAAAIVERNRLLVVSKRDAPAVFYLPGGKQDPGETAEQTLVRELGEELSVIPVDARLLGHIEEVAALERVPMRMTASRRGSSPFPLPPPNSPLDDRRRRVRPALGARGAQSRHPRAAKPRQPVMFPAAAHLRRKPNHIQTLAYQSRSQCLGVDPRSGTRKAGSP
jgi:8-oxo-dGTP pyrophosphatase MutT (NUDIX family)